MNANKQRAVISLGLALGTLLLYWPVLHHDFINIDDPRFVTENPQVRAGLTWPGVVWAFHSFYTEAWQPVTWLSHMLDCQMYGVKAWGHHLTSLLIHLANTLLLFLWLENLTKATWRSAVVAALFAWHPLHVESVAWVCERKDVLSAFFWLLALLAYSRYARRDGTNGQPTPGQGTRPTTDTCHLGRDGTPGTSGINGALWYLVVLGLYGLGLMSKPTVITLPCVMLLLDFWPFNRFKVIPATGFTDQRVIRKAACLIAEKVPFFLLAAAVSAAALYAQKAGGSLGSLGGLPLHTRLANALASYLVYLSQTFWPSGLAYFYPFNFDIPLVTVLLAVLVLAVWTGWFVLRVREQPYLLIGWLWFVGTLIPTIGLVQFCLQARADRYTYLPSVGLFMVVVWGVYDLLERPPSRRKLLPVLGGLALAGCLAVSWVQLGYWQNSVTLSRHAIEVTDHNYVAYESLGRALYERGRKPEAMECYAESIRIFPGFPQSQFNDGVALMDAGRVDEAIEHFAAAVKILPDHYELRDQLGTALLATGDRRLPEAASEFSEAVRLEPDCADAQGKLAVVLARQGKVADAIPHFSEATRLDPANAEFHFDFGLALLENHQSAEAAAQFAEELKLTPEETKAHYRFAQALEQQKKLAEAALQYRETLRRTPDFPEAKAALDRILAAHPDLK